VGYSRWNRWWSILFLLVPVLGVATFAVSMAEVGPFHRHWLPDNVNEFGGVIDDLYYFILYLTGAIFVGTGLAQFWFMWKYEGGQHSEPVKYTHGSHTLEVVWSILPAATLLFIAIYQMNAWADQKMRRPVIDVGSDQEEGTADDVYQEPLAVVTGRQFEWRIRYVLPGEDGKTGTSDDDLHIVNDLHIPVNEKVVLQIESQDVLHSFFLPNLRVKQDVVPGMKQFVWFQANRTGVYDIVCAELCGWGHYKMKGRLTVESRSDFDRWVAEQYALQQSTQLPMTTSLTESE
jgi:cytochrome c oxidase subunit 2